MANNDTTILIRNQTRERLKRIGYKGQTYDELINQLINLIITKESTSPSPNKFINQQEIISHE